MPPLVLQLWRFDDEKLSCLLGLVKATHAASVNERLTIEHSFTYFKESLLNHSVQRWVTQGTGYCRRHTPPGAMPAAAFYRIAQTWAASGSASTQRCLHLWRLLSHPGVLTSPLSYARCLLTTTTTMTTQHIILPPPPPHPHHPPDHCSAPPCSPPFSMGVFTQVESAAILRWMLQTYYRHYKLYQYAFTSRWGPGRRGGGGVAGL